MVVICAVLLMLAFGYFLLTQPGTKIEFDSPPAFVGRSSCIQCHQQEADLFHGSHHDLAMDLANESTVLADFDDQSFTHFGVTSKFHRRDGKYFVNTEGPDGSMQDFEVKYVFGYEPLQQYMVEIYHADTATDLETIFEELAASLSILVK